jgi:hypothetical protein
VRELQSELRVRVGANQHPVRFLEIADVDVAMRLGELVLGELEMRGGLGNASRAVVSRAAYRCL